MTTKESAASDIGRRLDAYIKAAGMNYVQFAKEVARLEGPDSTVSPQTITHWRKTGKIARERLMVICRVLHITPNALLGAEMNLSNIKETATADILESQIHARPIIAWDNHGDLPDGFVIVPRVRIRASAGTGKLIFEAQNHDQGNAFRTEWLNRQCCKPDNCVMMKVEGDSMEPTYTEGTDLLVDRCHQPIIDRKPYVLLHEGEMKVKRLFKAGDMVVMRSDNRDKYPDITVSVAAIQIVGRVIWHAGTD
ncbi:LexA family transcriptional regulator [Acidithiobacillus sp. MC6.1]|nr:LexA family transcriptional regulator [Acidithiobacillus sp. MC6.1]